MSGGSPTSLPNQDRLPFALSKRGTHTMFSCKLTCLCIAFAVGSTGCLTVTTSVATKNSGQAKSCSEDEGLKEGGSECVYCDPHGSTCRKHDPRGVCCNC
jgi:hypothetical protein